MKLIKSPESIMDWVDVTVLIKTGMTGWPGDPQVSVERFSNLEKGNEYNASRLSINTHTGTHMDAPLHFISGGDGIDKLPMDIAVGPARVIEIDNPDLIKPEELETFDLKEGERILFKTRNSPQPWYDMPFTEDYVHLSMEGARFLAEKRVSLVGIDYLSIAGFGPGIAEIHTTLLGAGIWIIEGLNLSEVHPGEHQLICLPLKIENSDGSPVRALLKPV